jgi:hypothetical protein
VVGAELLEAGQGAGRLAGAVDVLNGIDQQIVEQRGGGGDGVVGIRVVGGVVEFPGLGSQRAEFLSRAVKEAVDRLLGLGHCRITLVVRELHRRPMPSHGAFAYLQPTQTGRQKHPAFIHAPSLADDTDVMHS